MLREWLLDMTHPFKDVWCKGISEVPQQAVTLEPMVQGERNDAILRLLGDRACSPITDPPHS